MATRPNALLPLLMKAPSAGANGKATSDRDLLRRFARHKDEAAFADLVKRHGAMVLAVCQRVLGNPADAEDACQATFLVLACKAGSARWQPSVAGWLYATARQVALNARTARSRRTKHEGQAARKAAGNPLAAMTGEELLAILDEELDRLPPRYRDSLVLCYLQGLTRDEAASRLSVPLGTLKRRLERGRKRLGDALTRRGVALGAGLLACAITSRAGAVPVRVVNAVLASTRAPVPKSMSDLIRGVAVNGAGIKAILLTVGVIAAAMLGVGAVSPIGGGQTSDRPVAKKADADDKQPAVQVVPPAVRTYSGQVVGPEGKPVKGATVFAFEVAASADLPKPRDPETVRAAADGEGKFRISLPTGKAFMPSLYATAEGFGIGRVETRERTDDLTIPMVLDNPITGRVVTTEGKPVAGARIRIERIADDIAELEDLLNRLKAWGHHTPLIRRSMRVRFPELGTSTVSGKDGGFRLNGGGRERVMYVEVQADGFASDRIVVGNRPKFDPKPYNDAANKRAAAMRDRREREDRLYGPEIDLIVEPEKPIRGIVKDAETGKPRVGVQVNLTRNDQPRLHISATTDAKGQYELRGVRKAASYTVAVDSDLETRHVGVQVRVDDTAGYEPVIADIPVKKGVLITGKVIDAATKKPLHGFARVAVMPDNKFVEKYANFDPSPLRVTADKHGTYRVVTIPGPVLLMGGLGATTKYKLPVPDPEYPQYFRRGSGNVPICFGYGGYVIELVEGNYCKVLAIKADADVITHDILVERVD
jgi:RNA polymerase sigma factor (sigma-70 family)